jgi:hypothetical protein
MPLNDEGMKLLLENLDGIFPYVTNDESCGRYYPSQSRIWIATHRMDENGKVTAVDYDDVAFVIFYEIGRALGFGNSLCTAKAYHFMGGLTDGRRDGRGIRYIPIFERLGFHNVFAHAFSNSQMEEFLGLHYLSAQERQLLANQFDETVLDKNILYFNPMFPEHGIRRKQLLLSLAWWKFYESQ